MTLAFMQTFPKGLKTIGGKPTKFVEKIWQSFPEEITVEVFSDYLDGLELVQYDFDVNAIDMYEKIHTIRRDSKNRWNAGKDIHFAINNRTPERLQFAPVVKCVSTQEIEVTYHEDICDKNANEPTVIVDGKMLNMAEMETLAENDGFADTHEFCCYFNKDFKGKLIHWTNLKY